MKNITILIALFLVQFGFSQKNVITEIDEYGQLSFQSVLTIEGKSAEHIYNKTEEWVAYTYPSKEKVTLSKIKNKMYRISGIATSALGPYKGFLFDLSYRVQIDIKEDKIRVSINNLSQVSQRSPFTKIGMESLFKNGELIQKKNYIKFKTQIDLSLTIILNSLISEIDGSTNRDDW